MSSVEKSRSQRVEVVKINKKSKECENKEDVSITRALPDVLPELLPSLLSTSDIMSKALASAKRERREAI